MRLQEDNTGIGVLPRLPATHLNSALTRVAFAGDNVPKIGLGFIPVSQGLPALWAAGNRNLCVDASHRNNHDN